MTETATPIADQAAKAPGHLRLWDSATIESIWSSDTPRDAGPSLHEVLTAAGGWVLATYDYALVGRIWAGRMRIGENGDVEARPEFEFLAAIELPINTVMAPEAGSNE